ncbi:uncharacterized protein LOC135839373 [Planococcus citri]|uniref:uncharacterized protein LOC135839373 n=1 Tax=Planococcus citri TaxID=170843 RepID=UPI0031F77780
MDVSGYTLQYSIILLLISISTVYAACTCREAGLQVPMWEAPCGMKIDSDAFDDNHQMDAKIKRSMIMKSLKEVKQNLKLCLYFYQRQNYTIKTHNMKLPKIFSNGWLPTSQEVRDISVSSVETIPNIEQILYTMLQKYAMMFTEMLTDDEDIPKQKFAKRVLADLKSLLCDVQSSLISLEVRPSGDRLEIPQQYLYKGSAEKTARHLRDIEVISKYGDFLKQWLQWIRKTRQQFRKNKKKNRQNS